MKKVINWKMLLFLLSNVLLYSNGWAKNTADVDGATVATSDAESIIYVCPEDNDPDLYTFTNTSTSTANYRYVVTNEDLEIIGLPSIDMLDFDTTGVGVCLVWGVAFTGNFTAALGDNAATAVFSDDCFDLSDNFITVNRSFPNGGTVNTIDDEVIVYTCPGDGMEDLIHFKANTNSNLKYAYIITDPMLTILDISTADSINFENAPPGICWVWGVAYTGNLLTSIIGNNVSISGFSDKCYNLSNNFVVVNRDTPLGGAITLEDGTTEIVTCVGDGIGDELTFMNMDISNSAYAYLITDANNNILATTTESSFDFIGAGSGICRVWGLAYSGNLTAMAGDNTVSAMLSDDCFDLSNDFIEVNRTGVDGGMVETAEGENTIFVCVGDSNADVVAFSHETNASADYRYIVTDEDLNIIGLPMANEVNFENAPPGICLVWGLSYTGNFQAMMGDNAGMVAFSDDCFTLSENFVTVNRDDMADGGTVLTMAGDDVTYVCPSDNVPDLITFVGNTGSTLNYAYVITDLQSNIINITNSNTIDFDTAGVGVCLVWGLSYSGNIIAIAGDDAATVAFADGCYDLSSSFVTVNRDFPFGDEVSLLDGGNEITFCTNDGIADPVIMTTNSTANINYGYIITTVDSVIINSVESNELDFEGVPAGTCLVWGLSYAGNLVDVSGEKIGMTFFTDNCFNLSENFVTVNREIPTSGSVATATGATSVDLCIGDGLADMVAFATTSTEANYQYVITDSDNNIVGLPMGNEANFEGAGVGVCRVWGLAYTGTLTAMMGQNAATASLSDECFSLSENFITVNRTDLVAGEVSLASGGMSIELCVVDGIDDVIAFANTSADANYQYVITDSDNNILGLPSGNEANFEGAGAGVCRVWGLSYTGTLTAMMGQNAATTALSDDCYELSTNFVEVIRNTLAAGEVSIDGGGMMIDLCVGDGIADVVSFANTSTDANYQYVITDSDNNIVGLPMGNEADFDGAGVGICRVWGLSYTGTLTAMMGDNAATTALSDDCFQLSTNFITVNRTDLVAGEVSLASGATTIDICVGDGIPDVLPFTSSSTDANYQYVITDSDNNILGLPMGNEADFDDAGVGVCRVWGLSYTGTLTAMMGDNAATTTLSDACYELSINFIEVTRDSTGANCITSTFDLEAESEINIYPNPVVDELTITLDQLPETKVQLRVLDINGRLMLTREANFTANRGNIDLAVDHLASGVYLLSIQNGDFYTKRKFVKQ